MTAPIEKMHGLIEQLAGRFKGYLPWPDELRDSVVRGHEMAIEDTLRKADELLGLQAQESAEPDPQFGRPHPRRSTNGAAQSAKADAAHEDRRDNAAGHGRSGGGSAQACETSESAPVPAPAAPDSTSMNQQNPAPDASEPAVPNGISRTLHFGEPARVEPLAVSEIIADLLKRDWHRGTLLLDQEDKIALERLRAALQELWFDRHIKHYSPRDDGASEQLDSEIDSAMLAAAPAGERK